MEQIVTDIFDYNGAELKQTYLKGCFKTIRDKNLEDEIIKQFGSFDKSLLKKKSTEVYNVDKTRFEEAYYAELQLPSKRTSKRTN